MRHRGGGWQRGSQRPRQPGDAREEPGPFAVEQGGHVVGDGLRLPLPQPEVAAVVAGRVAVDMSNRRVIRQLPRLQFVEQCVQQPDGPRGVILAEAECLAQLLCEV